MAAMSTINDQKGLRLALHPRPTNNPMAGQQYHNKILSTAVLLNSLRGLSIPTMHGLNPSQKSHKQSDAVVKE